MTYTAASNQAVSKGPRCLSFTFYDALKMLNLIPIRHVHKYLAWQTQLSHQSNGPNFYFTLGYFSADSGRETRPWLKIKCTKAI